MTEELGMLSRLRRARARAVCLLVLFLLAFLAFDRIPALGLPFERMRESLRFPWQLDGEEGFLLNQALRLKRSQGLYPALAEPPYLVDNYPPLFPWLWSLWVDPAAPSLRGGRWIGGLSAFASAAGIALLLLGGRVGVLRRRFGLESRTGAKAWAWWAFSVAPAVLVAFIVLGWFLSFYEVLRWMAYARVDLPAVALSVAGLAVFAWGGRRGGWAMGASVLCFALALLFKQTALAAPAACFLYLALFDRRRAPRFVLAMILAAAAPVLILCLVTKGNYWRHTVVFNRNTMRWADLWYTWLPHLWRLYHWLLIAGAGLLGVKAVDAFFGRARAGEVRPAEPEGDVVFRLGLLYLVVNALALGALAKAGSAENYLIEPLAALVLFLGAALVSLTPCPREPGMNGGRFYLRGAGVMGALIALLLFGQFQGSRADIFLSWPGPSLEALVKGRQIVRTIEERPGDVLCEDPIYALQAGRPVLFQNFIMTQLAAEGRWDDSAIVERIRRREFVLIQAHSDLLEVEGFFNRHTPAMREAIRANYRPLGDPAPRPRLLQTIYLFIPRDDAGTK
jgi:hypothetical protein